MTKSAKGLPKGWPDSARAKVHAGQRARKLARLKAEQAAKDEAAKDRARPDYMLRKVMAEAAELGWSPDGKYPTGHVRLVHVSGVVTAVPALYPYNVLRLRTLQRLRALGSTQTEA
jgi:hypothetical protein